MKGLKRVKIEGREEGQRWIGKSKMLWINGEMRLLRNKLRLLRNRLKKPFLKTLLSRRKLLMVLLTGLFLLSMRLSQ